MGRTACNQCEHARELRDIMDDTYRLFICNIDSNPKRCVDIAIKNKYRPCWCPLEDAQAAPTKEDEG